MEEHEKNQFLFNEFCEDEYERLEMKKWISEKGITSVYEIVQDLFCTNDE